MKKGLLSLLFLSLVVGVLPSCGKKEKKGKPTKMKKTRKRGEKKAKPKHHRERKHHKEGMHNKKMENKKTNGRRYGMDDKSAKEELVA